MADEEESFSREEEVEAPDFDTDQSGPSWFSLNKSDVNPVPIIAVVCCLGVIAGLVVGGLETYNAVSDDNSDNGSQSLKTSNPTISPSLNPSEYPSLRPSLMPTEFPSSFPSIDPSKSPTSSPTESTSMPTNSPTETITSSPSSMTESPSIPPTRQPTIPPTFTDSPSKHPSHTPSQNPSKNPTTEPSMNPSQPPTSEFEAQISFGDISRTGIVVNVAMPLFILALGVVVFYSVRLFTDCERVRNNDNRSEDWCTFISGEFGTSLLIAIVVEFADITSDLTLALDLYLDTDKYDDSDYRRFANWIITLACLGCALAVFKAYQSRKVAAVVKPKLEEYRDPDTTDPDQLHDLIVEIRRDLMTVAWLACLIGVIEDFPQLVLAAAVMNSVKSWDSIPLFSFVMSVFSLVVKFTILVMFELGLNDPPRKHSTPNMIQRYLASWMGPNSNSADPPPESDSSVNSAVPSPVTGDVNVQSFIADETMIDGVDGDTTTTQVITTIPDQRDEEEQVGPGQGPPPVPPPSVYQSGANSGELELSVSESNGNVEVPGAQTEPGYEQDDLDDPKRDEDLQQPSEVFGTYKEDLIGVVSDEPIIADDSDIKEDDKPMEDEDGYHEFEEVQPGVQSELDPMMDDEDDSSSSSDDAFFNMPAALLSAQAAQARKEDDDGASAVNMSGDDEFEYPSMDLKQGELSQEEGM